MSYTVIKHVNVPQPGSAVICLNMNCSLNENVGTRSTPKRKANFMNPFRLFR